MPTYTVQGNLRNQRAETAARLALIFGHADAINMVITGLTITGTGGNAGVVTITIQNALSADNLAHLGLS